MAVVNLHSIKIVLWPWWKHTCYIKVGKGNNVMHENFCAFSQGTRIYRTVRAIKSIKVVMYRDGFKGRQDWQYLLGLFLCWICLCEMPWRIPNQSLYHLASLSSFANWAFICKIYTWSHWNLITFPDMYSYMKGTILLYCLHHSLPTIWHF